MRLRPKRGAKSMECKSGGISIKSKRTNKKTEPTGTEHMRMQHKMIRSKAVGKRTKPKRLCRRIKHMGKGKMVVCMRMMYENIDNESVE